EFEEPLKKALAAHVGHVPQGVLIGNGSNELIFHALLAGVAEGEAVLYPEPSFSLYRQNVQVLGGRAVAFRLRGENFTPNAREVIALAEEQRAAAIVLCSPNNPTGGLVPTADIDLIASSVEALVIVDEAYTNFAEDSAFRLLAVCPNLVLLRTFSKAFSLAGLRFGYLLAAPELAREIGKVQLPHHVNFFTQLAALVMLEEPELVVERVEAIKRERSYLTLELDRLDGVKIYPSQTNFILVEFAAVPAREVFARLLERGLLVRDVTGYPGLTRCLRITVGAPEDNQALVAAMQEVLE
ncbi:MAG TPA: aminotransferase class I/II-fold pyridoxal phosphate-dependent enzyme, partial [Candidatus Glassbacteria bacterium]|nr:aminotransferase class I/II-fold pyridoxal phosphate-dependent enzyme [Candidatus Glassbacteria bacterium]